MNMLNTNTSYTCPQWEVIDLPFRVLQTLEAPFAVTFGAVCHGPGGATLHLPGFYDGAQTFVLRFSPPDEGTWTFETYGGVVPAL